MSGGPAGTARTGLDWILILSLWLPVLSAVGCGRSYGHLAQERADFARRGEGNVLFAVIDDAVPSYLDGVRLAVDRMNAVGGVSGGRALEVMAGLLFMPPFATAAALTRYGFDTVLRMVPDNAAMATQSASVAALFGYRHCVSRFVLCRSRGLP